jgi:valyl-tRNA synthetase
MKDKYDPKEIKEIIENSYKYLHQTIEEARNILRKNAPKTINSLDYLLEFMNNRTISNNNDYSNYVKKAFGLDEGDLIKFYMLDNYFMAGIVRGISEYAKKLDPKDSDYNKRVNNIKEFIQRDLTDRTIFNVIYAGFLKKAFEQLKSKEKKSLKDYNDILQKISNDLMNTVENLLEYRIKNIEQFYNSLSEIKKIIYE